MRDNAKLHSASTASPVNSSNLSAVPEVYHDFTDVFSKAKATTLAPHCEYDLQIDLEEGASPPLGTVYSLSQTELGALRTFINEHLSYGLIQQSTSAHGAPVLFVRKKDGSLCLCVDYRGLNKISKKDHYPLPLISNLLDSPSKVKIYSKSISATRTIWSTSLREMNGRLRFAHGMAPSSGMSCLLA